MYQKAFTLIEVLIVLIIIAILVTMAFMSYQAYVVRNQLAEVFEQAGAYRTQFIASDQHCDAGREIGGPSQYIEKVIINESRESIWPFAGNRLLLMFIVANVIPLIFSSAICLKTVRDIKSTEVEN